MTLKIALAALVAFSVSGAALATEPLDVPLVLTGATGFDGTAAPKHARWMDDDLAPPASMQSALDASILESLADSATSFSKEVGAVAEGVGGGDDGGGGYVLLEVLAFILGVIPGFGIGHLVAGSIFGFVTWLCIDIVIGIVLFWILPIIIFPAFQYMYTISVIAVVIERIFEGYSAFRSAYWHYDGGRFNGGGPYRDNRSGMIDTSPNLATVHF
jgi:hypothetical protein